MGEKLPSCPILSHTQAGVVEQVTKPPLTMKFQAYSTTDMVVILGDLGACSQENFHISEVLSFRLLYKCFQRKCKEVTVLLEKFTALLAIFPCKYCLIRLGISTTYAPKHSYEVCTLVTVLPFLLGFPCRGQDPVCIQRGLPAHDNDKHKNLQSNVS